MAEKMILTREQVQADIDTLPEDYKTRDVDALIKRYVKAGADVSALREYVLTEQQFHRIYFYVSLDQIENVEDRLAFINKNLLFDDWWHTDGLIGYVADLDFNTALSNAKNYVKSDDPFIRRWGYVMFIGRLGKGHAEELLPLMKDDDHYYVQMGEAWLAAELAVDEPDQVYRWMPENGMKYKINGKAIQKICDSFRISEGWKEKFKGLRKALKARK